MAKKQLRGQTETPEIDPDKWEQFERTLKRALGMPHKPHQLAKKSGEGGAPAKRKAKPRKSAS